MDLDIMISVFKVQRILVLYSLPVNLIRQYLFCARIPYFMEVQKLNPSYPLWVKQGSEYHDRQTKLMNRRTLERFNLTDATVEYNVHLSSEKIGLHGKVDALLITDESVIPVEFKMTLKKPSWGHIMQLVAYGILAEEKYGKPCIQGFILHDKRGKTLPIEISNDKKHRLLNLIQEIKNSFESVLPSSPASITQCTQCEFYVHCNDRE